MNAFASQWMEKKAPLREAIWSEFQHGKELPVTIRHEVFCFFLQKTDPHLTRQEQESIWNYLLTVDAKW
ncbi:hypothetical protein [uncultured Mitsuokella sp.]|uniref:hypothetical protein n=1 Tax=uncultured Mitsuokella sp. TaxID=453120 RepID=UPI00266CFCFC|nr:hypothetical protein [uncultured Mitsuokella sp.]